MTPRGLWQVRLAALLLAALAHLLPLLAMSIPPVPTAFGRSAEPSRTRLVYQPDPPERPGADQPVAVTEPPARRVTIQRQRTVHAAATPPRPAARPRPKAPVTPPARRPEVPTAAPRRPPHPLVAALADPRAGQLRAVRAGARELDLVVLAPGGDLPARGAARHTLIVAAGDDRPPSGASRLWSALPADDEVFVRPHDVRAWWRDLAIPPAWIEQRGSRVEAIWLPAAVRAGWEARHPQALALWDNLSARAGWDSAP